MPRILLIEDDADEREIMASLLRHRGFDVVEAESGLRGVGLVRETRPDLIISDIRLPDLHGVLIGELLHHHPQTANIPVIGLSHYELSPQEVRRAGFQAFFRKPVEADVLEATIRDLVKPTGG